MSAPNYADLAKFTGQTIAGGDDADHPQAVISVVTSMTNAYTRDKGFFVGEPND
jgi:hypothetical protein